MIHLLRGPFEKASGPLVDFLIRHRFSASLLTLVAFLGTILASVLIYYQIWIIGASLFLVFSLFDALDGSLARRNNSAKPMGAFLDSVMDRFSDSAILFAIICYAFNVGNRDVFLLGLLALIASLITSYIKAKAENFLKFGSIGLLQRPERILIIFLMLLFPQYLLLGLGILVIGGYITICQRIYSAYQKLDQQSS
ncbi:MAG: CDP-alcohol phosphatidyltransferase family protein [Desulfobacterales bacterium]|nr:CDP-alcohol phosphatidyltransferase family protein [Desulfobacterales bacterium]